MIGAPIDLAILHVRHGSSLDAIDLGMPSIEPVNGCHVQRAATNATDGYNECQADQGS